MNPSFLPNTGKVRSRAISGLFRAFTSILLIAAFGLTSAHAQTVAYVVSSARQTGGTVSVIDTATNTVTSTISLPPNPAGTGTTEAVGAVVSPDGARLYVGDLPGIPNVANGDLYVIDTSSNTVINTFELPGEFATFLAVTPDGKTLYGSNSDFEVVLPPLDLIAIDASSGAITATIPGIASGALAITPNGATIYVINSSGALSAVSTAHKTITATIPLGAGAAFAAELAITPDGAFLYVPNSSNNTVSVIATKTNRVVTTIPVGASPAAVAISPDGAFAYVANFADNTESVIATATNTVVGPPIPSSGGSPFYLAFTPDGAFVYVVDSTSVDVIATATNTVVANVPVANFPQTLTIASLPQPGTPSSIAANFNGTAIPSGDSLWFSSVVKAFGLGSNPVTISMRQASISFTVNGTPTTVPVPDADITFDPSATTATTTFNTSLNRWQTTVPSSGLAGNMFLDGAPFALPNGLPGGIQNVTWTARLSSDTLGISLNWKWAAAAYTSLCGPDLNCLGVKPVDDNQASQYQNSDHAGTPENFKANVVGGATGGGGSNFTGGYSGTKSVLPTRQ